MDYIENCPLSAHVALMSALAPYENLIGPVAGRPASSGTMADGTTYLLPAVGDPTREYVNVRAAAGQPQPNFPAGCVASDPATSAAVIGVWAIINNRLVVTLWGRPQNG